MAATIFVPSAEQATDDQLVMGALVWIQFWASERSTPTPRLQRATANKGVGERFIVIRFNSGMLSTDRTCWH